MDKYKSLLIRQLSTISPSFQNPEDKLFKEFNSITQIILHNIMPRHIHTEEIMKEVFLFSL